MLLLGMLAGLQTNPAVLSFALEQTGNDQPNIGYARVYPTALIAKILLAQVLLTLLRERGALPFPYAPESRHTLADIAGTKGGS